MQVITAIQNMSLQHREFINRLRDVERLRLYVQSGLSTQESLDASLKDVQMIVQRLELEAKEAADKEAWAEEERDAARHETAMARLEIEAVGNARAPVESELSRVQCALTTSEGGWLKAESELEFLQQALAAAKEACRKAEEENGRLTDERLSLVMEPGATKEDFAAFREKSSAEKSALEAEFDASGDVIFNYGYGCCALAHDIRGSKPMIPIGMLDASTALTPDFFSNPRCPPGSSSALPAADPVEIIGEDLPAEDPPIVEGGVDIPTGPPTRPNQEPKVIAEG